jgi:hypothetical protein
MTPSFLDRCVTTAQMLYPYPPRNVLGHRSTKVFNPAMSARLELCPGTTD